MLIYVDESGVVNRKSDKYFTIAFFVVSNHKKVDFFKRRVHRFNSKEKTVEIKGEDLNFVKRQKLLNWINKEKDDYFVNYITVNKEKILNNKLFENPSIFYNYLFQFVFKEIVFNYLQDNEIIDEDIIVHVDERNIKIDHGKFLEEYLKTKMVEWGVNNFQKISVKYFDSKSVKLIQLADVVAGIINNKYKTGKKQEYSLINIRNSKRFPQDSF